MKRLIVILSMIALPLMAQNNVVFYDGTDLYSAGGTVGVERVSSVSIDTITVSTNWGWECWNSRTSHT